MNLSESLSSLFINLNSLYRKNIKIENLTFPQILILYIIPEQGEQLSKLSEKIGVDISTMSRAIKVLENKNYVKRGYFEADKRVIRVIPLPKSKKIKAKILYKFNKVNSLIEKHKSKKELYKIEQDLHELNWIILKSLIKKINI